MYSIGNIVNSTAITCMVTDGYQTCSDQLIMYINVESLCSTPETNIMYVNYTSIKINCNNIVKVNITTFYFECIIKSSISCSVMNKSCCSYNHFLKRPFKKRVVVSFYLKGIKLVQHLDCTIQLPQILFIILGTLLKFQSMFLGS